MSLSLGNYQGALPYLRLWWYSSIRHWSSCGTHRRPSSGIAPSGADICLDDDTLWCHHTPSQMTPYIHGVEAQGRSQGFSKKSITSFHSPTEWASWMPPTPKKDIRSMCAVFAAHGRPGLSHRECHWVAPVQLAAVQPGPWLRPARSCSPYKTRRARGTWQQDSQDKQINKRI